MRRARHQRRQECRSRAPSALVSGVRRAFAPEESVQAKRDPCRTLSSARDNRQSRFGCGFSEGVCPPRRPTRSHGSRDARGRQGGIEFELGGAADANRMPPGSRPGWRQKGARPGLRRAAATCRHPAGYRLGNRVPRWSLPTRPRRRASLPRRATATLAMAALPLLHLGAPAATISAWVERVAGSREIAPSAGNPATTNSRI